MRRVGVNCLFKGENPCYDRSVVELYDERVCNYYSIDPDNLDMCEWIGGTVFLSAMNLEDLPKAGSVTDLLQHLASCTDYPTKAFHLPTKAYKQGYYQAGQLVQLADEEFD